MTNWGRCHQKLLVNSKNEIQVWRFPKKILVATTPFVTRKIRHFFITLKLSLFPPPRHSKVYQPAGH